MRIHIKLFAILRERAGVDELDLDLPQGASVADAAEALVLQNPNLRDIAKAAGYAVNRAYVPATTVLHDRDELAIIPPVSGG